jgi:hypothetical protein
MTDWRPFFSTICIAHPPIGAKLPYEVAANQDDDYKLACFQRRDHMLPLPGGMPNTPSKWVESYLKENRQSRGQRMKYLLRLTAVLACVGLLFFGGIFMLLVGPVSVLDTCWEMPR